MLEKYLDRIKFDSYEDFKENYKVNIPENFNFGFDVVDGWAKENKNKKALVWCDDHNGKKEFTFDEISKLSNKTANFFKSLGIKKGSVVMLILRQRYEYWICATALMKIGAIFIPGSLQLAKKDLVYRANAANIEMFVCLDNDYVLTEVDKTVPETPSVKHKVIVNGKKEGWISMKEEIDEFSDEFVRPTNDDEMTHNNDTMQIYFTSGTTGMPKMVCHNYLHPLGHIVTAKYWQRVQEDKLHLTVTDSGWAKFGWGKIYGQWLSGCVVFAYDYDRFDPIKHLELMQDYKITTFCAPPTIYRMLIRQDVANYDLSSIKHWCTAGEPLNPEVYNRWYDLTGGKIATGFGQTEGTVLIADYEWFESRPGSTGKPSPIYDIKLLNKDGNVCEIGEEGEIVVDGVDKNPPVGLFTGYYKDEEQTNKALGSGCYNLKDVAWCDQDGYYWFVGRHDDVIKCSGYRIGPFEVESALITHPAVVESAVTAAPDPIRGQVVKATIVLAEGYEPSEELIKILQNHVKKATAPYKYPRVIEFVEELPKTLGGKIMRAKIRKEDKDK